MTVTEVIEGLPIRLERREATSLIEWRGGVLTFGLASGIYDMSPEVRTFMQAHELGHVLAATDDQLRMPNLGLPLPGGARLAPEEVKRTETIAMATSFLFDQKRREGAMNAARVLFKVRDEDVNAWLAEWSIARVREGLQMQIAKLQS